MRPFLKIFTALSGLALVLIQLVPAQRSNPPVEADFDEDPAIEAILRAKCYDCHSNETQWPLYAYVAPVSWFVIDHVNEGRKELNFSRWGSYTPAQRENKAEEIFDEIFDDLMPLPSYRLLHPHSTVTEAELALIESWMESR